MKNKVIVIGLDGATFDIIKPLINEGKLPVIASLLSKGASAELQSTLPPISGPAWTSFLTGMNPGKHGVFHFLTRRSDGNGFLLCSSHDIKTPTIFDYISAEDKTIGSINIPMTYPPPKVNGFIVSGIPVPPQAKDYTYPYELYEDIKMHVGDYTIDYDFSSMNKKVDSILDEIERYRYLAENLMDIEERRLKTGLFLMNKYPCDLFVIVLTLLDRVQHYFWRFMDKRHAGYSDIGAKEFGRVIHNCYEKIDKAIGEIISSSSDNTTFIVMSDHGSGPHYSDFHINKWFIDIGWLQMKSCPRVILNRSNIKRILTKLGFKKLSEKLPPSLNSLSIFIPKVKRENDFIDIVWSKTLAYSAFYGISINLKGREERGIIEPGEEYQKLIEVLKARLYQLIDPRTGEPLIENILEKNEIYSGPFSDQGPDILFLTKDLNCIPSDSYTAHSWYEIRVNHATSGTHRMNGIFIMKGKGIKNTEELQNLKITDIAPTILYLLHAPIPKGMDGRLITEAFTPQFLNENKIKFTDIELGYKKERRSFYSAQEEEMLKESLKGLGYMS
ncbi:MAG: alkaline phosphatase family protein [Nitrospirae bacterium]|nr:alkaline phosphatase family protein [Nitrospirota bacterium]